MYNTAQYFLSKNIIQIPEIALLPFIFVIPIYYFMSGLGVSATQYFTHFFIYFLLSFFGASFGLLIGSICADSKDVSVLVTLAMLPMIVFSGYFKNRQDLPDWIGWVEYLSPNKYGFTALVLNEVQDRPSLVKVLNFDFELWPAIGVLIGLGVFFRLLALSSLQFLDKERIRNGFKKIFQTQQELPDHDRQVKNILTFIVEKNRKNKISPNS